MPPPEPGRPDLYAIAVAGDGDEDVFRNEALYFEQLVTARYGAGGRAMALVNHPRSLEEDPRPLATPANLRLALQGLGQLMDPEEDLLLLFITSHGSRDHALTLRLAGHGDAALRPAELREALDASGIRNRLLIVSACYSGGFIRDLAGPATLVITAARHDRPSFGCGDSGSATWFGRALLVEGFNRDEGLVGAFEYAKRQVARRETSEDVEPSFPQISIGEDIAARLRAWEARLVRGPHLPYPHPL
ncbi:C13 family peptidase [Luteimonas sp. SDU101]|uniref:C13 family peptidase n=1 Tax=Luteimonas sp. SDU101 TaxID=3422593 RepID=UPI003EBAE4CB